MINKLNIRLNTKLSIINSIIKILLLVVIMFTLALGISLERRDIVNSGQVPVTTKLKEELQFPNIYLEEEADWVNKLGVTLPVSSWNQLFNNAYNKYPYANIIVSGNALEKLRKNTTPLLPNYFDILNFNDDLRSDLLLKISIGGNGSIVSPDIVRNCNVELLYFNPITGEHYIFTYYEPYAGDYPARWICNRPIEMNLLGTELQYKPRFADRFRIEFSILGLPMLNPIANDKEITVVVETEISELTPQDDSIAKINFVTVLHGTDTQTDYKYRIVYTGDASLLFFDNYDGTSTISMYPNHENTLWIQIYVKAPGDDFYTMTHREEAIGVVQNGASCYIKSIELIPNNPKQ